MRTLQSLLDGYFGVYAVDKLLFFNSYHYMADDYISNSDEEGEAEGLSILNSETEQISTEQSENEKPATSEVPMSSKFMAKTNQKMADQARFISYLARGITPQELKEENPELAERLKRNKDFQELFLDESDPEDQESIIDKKINERLGLRDLEAQKTLALKGLTFNGEKLPTADVNTLKKSDEFIKRFDALVAGGISPDEAAEEAFERYLILKGHQKEAKKVGRTVLNGSSLATPYVKPSLNLSEQDRKLMKSFGIKEDEVEI